MSLTSVSPAPETAGGRWSGLNPSSAPHLKRKHLRWRDKHGGQQTVKELPGDRPLDGGVTSGLGSPGGEGPLLWGSFIKSRWMLVSSTPVPHVYAAGSPLPFPTIRPGHAPGSTQGFVPCPGARTPPSWGSMWGNHPGHPCRLPAAPQGHKLEFYPFCAPPQFPHKMVNLSQHQLPPPGFLAPSYPGP